VPGDGTSSRTSGSYAAARRCTCRTASAERAALCYTASRQTQPADTALQGRQAASRMRRRKQ
jgi:hypothetical protein